MRSTALLVLCALSFFGCAGEIFRSFPPEPNKQVRVDVPIFGHRRLQNGLTIIHSGANTAPQVVIQLALRVGNAALPDDKAGLLWLWLSSIAEADQKEQQALDELGDVPDVSVDPISSTLTLTVANQDAEAAINTLARLIRAPKLDPQVFARRQARQLALLRSWNRDPYVVANRVLRKSLYGAQHPMAQFTEGTIESVSKLTVEDLERFHQAFVGPQNLAVVIVGLISEEDAMGWTQRAFGDWQAAVRLPPSFPSPPPPPRRKVYFVPTPGLAQSVLMVGGPSPAAGQVDEHAFTIAAHILSARIHRQLRNKENVTYGTRLSINARPAGGHFALSTAVEVNATAASLEEVMSQSFLLAAGGFWAHNMPKFRLLTVFDSTSAYSTLSGTAEAAGELFCYNRPITHPQEILSSIPKITADDVQDAVTRYLSRDHFQVVVIADRRYYDDIAKLKLGPIEIEQPR